MGGRLYPGEPDPNDYLGHANTITAGLPPPCKSLQSASTACLALTCLGPLLEPEQCI